MDTTAATRSRKGPTMARKSTPKLAAGDTFAVTATFVRTEAEAIASCQKHLAKVPGFSTTGRAWVRSEKHLLWQVEVRHDGGNVDDCWVTLTSYGLSPDATLGSVWQDVPGLGC